MKPNPKYNVGDTVYNVGEVTYEGRVIISDKCRGTVIEKHWSLSELCWYYSVKIGRGHNPSDHFLAAENTLSWEL